MGICERNGPAQSRGGGRLVESRTEWWWSKFIDSLIIIIVFYIISNLLAVALADVLTSLRFAAILCSDAQCFQTMLLVSCYSQRFLLPYKRKYLQASQSRDLSILCLQLGFTFCDQFVLLLIIKFVGLYMCFLQLHKLFEICNCVKTTDRVADLDGTLTCNASALQCSRTPFLF